MNRVRGPTWIAVVACGFFALSAQTQIAADLPVCVAGPPNRNNGICLRELFEQPKQWKQTRAATNELLYADWAFKRDLPK